MREFDHMLYAAYELGDMTACYYRMKSGQMSLQLLPAGTNLEIKKQKRVEDDSLIQVKLLGDDYPSAYSGGTTMRNSGTVYRCRFDRQDAEWNGDIYSIRTVLRDDRELEFWHLLTWKKGTLFLTVRTGLINHSRETVTLEMLSSFSIGEITPYQEGDASGSLRLHRIRSKWSQEGRVISESCEDLLLEPSWGYYPANSVRYGQVGSMPVKGYFPFGAVEDTKAGVIWGAQLAIEGSWQMEFYRRDDMLCMSGGLADREFGHWMKEVKAGEAFATPEAILTVCADDLDTCCQRLTSYGEESVKSCPREEEELPILFNEYCTTWGLPSHENICRILDAIKTLPIRYFVIDCGWFVEEGIPWESSMGDYVPSDKLFPNGLGATCQSIRDAGMLPGIWFEIDNVGRDAHVFQREDLLLKRDGHVLTTESRRFFDMRKPEVIQYLTDKVIGQLKKYGFAYMKMDYNDTIGIGCDGAESLGEGLRQDREASLDFVRKVREEIPGIILENCSSGGHKLEPLMMSLCSMASFSDAHECPEIPVIAAALHRCILPRQSQIWSAIRQTDSLKRMGYSLAATFLGRMCLSGDVTGLSQEQTRVIDEACAFYRRIVPILRHGFSYLISERGSSDRHLTGYQAVIRCQSEDGKLKEGRHEKACVIVHVFEQYPEVIRIPLPEGCPDKMSSVYRTTGITAEIQNHVLIIHPSEAMEAIACELENDLCFTKN